MASGLRSGTLESLRDVLSAACEAIGVDPLNIRIRGETVVIEDEGVSVSLEGDGSRVKWNLTETYEVTESGGTWNERTETSGRFEVGDETQCARAAAILVAEHRVDAALDRHK